MLQAVGGGILLPLTTNIFLKSFPPEKRGSAMGVLGLGLILAPAIGPTVSGFVIQSYNWNVLFYAVAAIGAGILIASLFLLDSQGEKGDAKLDIWGVVLSSIGFGCLLYGVGSIANKGWNDPEVLSSLAIAVILLTVFCIFRAKEGRPSHRAESF